MAARKVSEIYDSINAEKSNMASLTDLAPAIDDEQTLLTDLSSTSKVAHWRLFAYVIALAMFVHETLWDLFKAAVEAIIAKFRPGTLRWYQEQAFAFQYGYELEWNTTERKYEYATADEAAKIVKLCSVTEPGGIVRIKAATLSGTDVVAITAPQLAALNAYFNKVKYPGKVTCVSFDADLLKIYGTVKYDPLAVVEVVQTAVEETINSYLKGLEFNGRFNINQLIDRVQAVTGVVDFTSVNVSTKYGGLAYQAVNAEYQTYAGYAEIDEAAFPLSTTIAYVPYV